MKRITDKMRLDWIGKHNWPFNLGAWKNAPWIVHKKYGEHLGVGQSPRAAIDAAILSEARAKDKK